MKPLIAALYALLGVSACFLLIFLWQVLFSSDILPWLVGVVAFAILVIACALSIRKYSSATASSCEIAEKKPEVVTAAEQKQKQPSAPVFVTGLASIPVTMILDDSSVQNLKASTIAEIREEYDLVPKKKTPTAAPQPEQTATQPAPPTPELPRFITVTHRGKTK